jgi:hypothetical protein
MSAINHHAGGRGEPGAGQVRVLISHPSVLVLAYASESVFRNSQVHRRPRTLRFLYIELPLFVFAMLSTQVTLGRPSHQLTLAVTSHSLVDCRLVAGIAGARQP